MTPPPTPLLGGLAGVAGHQSGTAGASLRSRFTRTISFRDYTTQELLLIFRGMLPAAELQLEESAATPLKQDWRD